MLYGFSTPYLSLEGDSLNLLDLKDRTALDLQTWILD